VAARGRIGIVPRRVTLRFDRSGLSQPVPLRLARALPATVGRVKVRWSWTFGGAHAGTSVHEILLAFRRPRATAHWLLETAARQMGIVDGGKRWVYRRIMEWTCDWGAGRTTDKALCDAILARLPRSGIQYAKLTACVRDVLRERGGYCGELAKTFVAMAGAQGVTAHKRCFLVDWRPLTEDDQRWCALVVRNPGINRAAVTWAPSDFHDASSLRTTVSKVRNVTERRYRFWGKPGCHLDGHCFAVLEYRGRYYIYDPSFMRRPVGVDWRRLPVPSARRTYDVGAMGNFRSVYLDQAVDYMLGTIRLDGKLYRTTSDGFPGSDDSPNGLTVRTAHIQRSAPGISFYWMI
jgi:hypothetical protein